MRKIIALANFSIKGFQFPSFGGVAKIQRIFDGVVEYSRIKNISYHKNSIFEYE
ncbi:hypothetical protein ACR1PO_14710 [Chryseobacterium sp. RRHN12]|uniref:hypothetical protein n=1 Tax=Chryseobacterium sp. RRHN12 TaxID=3437884 RepID=UPI003D9B0899